MEVSWSLVTGRCVLRWLTLASCDVIELSRDIEGEDETFLGC